MNFTSACRAAITATQTVAEIMGLLGGGTGWAVATE